MQKLKKGKMEYFRPQTKGTIKELAKIWLNNFNKADWEKHGVKIVKRVTETVEII